MSEDTQEKEFDPSPQKLLEARKKGEIAKSADLNTAASYLGFLACLYFIFDARLVDLGDHFVTLIESSSNTTIAPETSAMTTTLGATIRKVFVILAPVFIVPAVFVILSAAIQRSITFAPSKIEPKLTRISPISGLKNKYGRAGLFEFAKSSAKLVFFISILALFVQVNFDRIAVATRLPPGAALLNIGSLLYAFLFIIFGIALTIGLLDFSFQYADHIRKNRMSRKEIEEELKQSEGDPMMKQRRRQKAIALATNSMMADVPDASVVIVNPTHYAVALKWDQAAAIAPIVVAMGVDEVALRIRQIARENMVPLHSNPSAARSLFAVASIGEPVPPAHYEAVAAAIRFAEDMRRKQAQSYG